MQIILKFIILTYPGDKQRWFTIIYDFDGEFYSFFSNQIYLALFRSYINHFEKTSYDFCIAASMKFLQVQCNIYLHSLHNFLNLRDKLIMVVGTFFLIGEFFCLLLHPYCFLFGLGFTYVIYIFNYHQNLITRKKRSGVKWEISVKDYKVKVPLIQNIPF